MANTSPFRDYCRMVISLEVATLAVFPDSCFGGASDPISCWKRLWAFAFPVLRKKTLLRVIGLPEFANQTMIATSTDYRGCCARIAQVLGCSTKRLYGPTCVLIGICYAPAAFEFVRESNCQALAALDAAALGQKVRDLNVLEYAVACGDVECVKELLRNKAIFAPISRDTLLYAPGKNMGNFLGVIRLLLPSFDPPLDFQTQWRTVLESFEPRTRIKFLGSVSEADLFNLFWQDGASIEQIASIVELACQNDFVCPLRRLDELCAAGRVLPGNRGALVAIWEKNLPRAAEYGSNNCLEWLLRQPDIDTDARDELFMKTAVIDCCTSGYFDCLQVLLESGADPNMTDTSGRNALMRCLPCSGVTSVEAVILLLDHGAILTCTEWNRDTLRPEVISLSELQLLCDALQERDIPVDRLCSASTDPSMVETALMWACEIGREAAIGYLLAKGADPTLRNSVGENALHLVLSPTPVRGLAAPSPKSRYNCLEALLPLPGLYADEMDVEEEEEEEEEGPSEGMNATDINGITPLMNAASLIAPDDEEGTRWLDACVKLLLDYFADPLLRESQDGFTALDFAKSSGLRPDCVQMLEEAEKDITEQQQQFADISLSSE